MRRMTLFRAWRQMEIRLAESVHRVPAMRAFLVRRFAADLRRLHDAIEQTGLDGHYWVWGGLLLGWAREGAILPHDCLDADFGVRDEDFHYLADAVPAIIKAGFRCDRRFINNEGYITELTFIRHGARFDFFRLFPEAGRLRYFLYSLAKNIELEALVPDQGIVPFSFIGRTWLRHEDHEAELRTMYGSWEVPDPSWSYMEAPCIEARRTWQQQTFDWLGGADWLVKQDIAPKHPASPSEDAAGAEKSLK